MTTDPHLALLFCVRLFEELRRQLSDPTVIHGRLAEIHSHAPTFPEVLFCKGCVLPIVDSVTTRFLTSEMALSRSEIHAALRCEGFSSLHKIYSPDKAQSGYSGFTWGTNFQRTAKHGTAFADDHPGSRPCPDFGIVHHGSRPFALLGEAKFKRSAPRITTTGIERDLRYYMGLATEPDKDWHYSFGFGVAYAAGGTALRQSRLITDHWVRERFVIAQFCES